MSRSAAVLPLQPVQPLTMFDLSIPWHVIGNSQSVGGKLRPPPFVRTKYSFTRRKSATSTPLVFCLEYSYPVPALRNYWYSLGFITIVPRLPPQAVQASLSGCVVP